MHKWTPTELPLPLSSKQHFIFLLLLLSSLLLSSSHVLSFFQEKLSTPNNHQRTVKHTETHTPLNLIKLCTRCSQLNCTQTHTQTACSLLSANTNKKDYKKCLKPALIFTLSRWSLWWLMMLLLSKQISKCSREKSLSGCVTLIIDPLPLSNRIKSKRSNGNRSVVRIERLFSCLQATFRCGEGQ